MKARFRKRAHLYYTAPVEKCYRHDELPDLHNTLHVASLNDASHFYSNLRHEPEVAQRSLEALGLTMRVPITCNKGLGCYDVLREVNGQHNKNLVVFDPAMCLVNFTNFEVNLFLHWAATDNLPDALRIIIGMWVQQQSEQHSTVYGSGGYLHKLLFHETKSRERLIRRTTDFIHEFVCLFGTKVVYVMKGELELSFIVKAPAAAVYTGVLAAFPRYSVEVTPLSAYTTRGGLGILDDKGVSIEASTTHRIHLPKEVQAAFESDAQAELRRRKLQALLTN